MGVRPSGRANDATNDTDDDNNNNGSGQPKKKKIKTFTAAAVRIGSHAEPVAAMGGRY